MMTARQFPAPEFAARQPAPTTPLDRLQLSALPVAACLINASGRIAAYNELWRELMTSDFRLKDFVRRDIRFISVCKLLGTRCARALAARVVVALRKAGCRNTRPTEPLSTDFPVSERHLRIRVTTLPESDGGCLVYCEDVTSLRRIECDLQTSQANAQSRSRSAMRYELLANFAQFVLEAPPLDRLTDRTVHVVCEALGARHCRLLLLPEHASESTGVADRERNVSTPRELCEDPQFKVMISGTDRTYGALCVWIDSTDSAAAAVYLQNVAKIIAAHLERKSTEDRLAFMAQYDTLTGLPNRQLFNDRLSHAIDVAARDDGSVAVLFVDIDRFKAVNDTLGHAAGDDLLTQIAERMRATVRSGDTIGRISGDEFALVLSQLAHADHAGIVGQKLTAALAKPFVIQGRDVHVSGSVGISLYPADGDRADVLLKHADMAMYRAKHSGRNACQFYQPRLQERAKARAQLEERLRSALERDEYVLEYQPRLHLPSGRLCGTEVLLRWRNPDGDLVAAQEIMPVLEETGLIVPVGERILALASAQLRAWQAAGWDPPPVSINISPKQFQHDRTGRALSRAISGSDIDPRLLLIEIPEFVLMRDPHSALAVLRVLKRQGVSLVLDNFGTGFSRLRYLKLLPIDAVKIDRMLIRSVPDDEDNTSVVAAMAGLARRLDLRVIANGVETSRQVSFLRQHGCCEAQGFGLYRPLPVEEVTNMLSANWRWSPGDSTVP